jgi:hypothetical protein
MLSEMSSVEFLEWQTRAVMLAEVDQLNRQTKDYELAYRAVFEDKD